MTGLTAKLRLRRYVTLEELPGGQWHAFAPVGDGAGVGSYATALCNAVAMANNCRFGVLSLNRAGEIVYLVHADRAQ